MSDARPTDAATRPDAPASPLPPPQDKVVVPKHVLGDLSANVERWKNRARSVSRKRDRWRLRAVAAEATLAARMEAVTLTDAEKAALRDILDQWVWEGFTTPPYTDEQYSLFEKVGLTEHRVYDVRRPVGEWKP
jgi:hypothetical protein